MRQDKDSKWYKTIGRSPKKGALENWILEKLEWITYNTETKKIIPNSPCALWKWLRGTMAQNQFSPSATFEKYTFKGKTPYSVFRIIHNDLTLNTRTLCILTFCGPTIQKK